MKRRAKLDQGGEHPCRILGARSNPDIEIPRSADEAVCCQSVRSDDQILNAMLVECG
jgi:hypothetical protein